MPQIYNIYTSRICVKSEKFFFKPLVRAGKTLIDLRKLINKEKEHKNNAKMYTVHTGQNLDTRGAIKLNGTCYAFTAGR